MIHHLFHFLFLLIPDLKFFGRQDNLRTLRRRRRLIQVQIRLLNGLLEQVLNHILNVKKNVIFGLICMYLYSILITKLRLLYLLGRLLLLVLDFETETS